MRIRSTLKNGPLGFGAGPLGNMYRNVPDDEALATVDAAWQFGTRYFDTAPLYGAGLSEMRLGKALAKHKRDEYVLSTKVGRIILDEIDPNARDLGEKSGLFEHGRHNRIVHDYSADGVRRSIDGSLKRLGVDRIDFIWVHDIARDFFGDEWITYFDTARKGAFVALSKLRDEGVIKAWGLGVNRVEACETAIELDENRPDGFLLAGRYTLLDHELALQRLVPMAAEKKVDMVIGGPYSSGILAGGAHFEYRKAPPEIVSKVERIKAICERHGVPVKAAAIQFVLANPASAAVIPGGSKPDRMREDQAALAFKIPGEFWDEMRKEKLVVAGAPLPGQR
jgi:D-threo-aldose 1-dehydrogenase